MLSSATVGEECNCNCSCSRKSLLNRGSFSFSSSRSTPSPPSSPTPSPFSPPQLHPTPRSTRAMEEVWNDINLASLNNHSTRPAAASSVLHGVSFQDFLARPLAIDPRTSMVSSGSPAPATALSLSSRPDEFHFDPVGPKDLQLVQPHHHNHPASKVSPFGNPFESLACPSSPLPSFGSKRLAESDCSPAGDRRNKRMIKNRESAARSRARKQAYTNELQLKVNHLLEENARLRRQQQQLCESTASQQKKKRNRLYRTSTAPF